MNQYTSLCPQTFTGAQCVVATTTPSWLGRETHSHRQKARCSQELKPNADSVAPQQTQMNMGACWAAGERAMSRD